MSDAVTANKAIEGVISLERAMDLASKQGLRGAARVAIREVKRHTPVYGGRHAKDLKAAAKQDKAAGRGASMDRVVPGLLRASVKQGKKLHKRGPHDWAVYVAPMGGKVNLYRGKVGAPKGMYVAEGMAVSLAAQHEQYELKYRGALQRKGFT